MTDGKCDEKSGKDAPLSCALCLREMPHDLAHTHEGPDYVHHFCGLECYRKWQEQHTAEDAKKA